MFAEPDRTSPERIAETLGARDALVAERLRKLPPNDQILAESIRRAGAVLGVVGEDEIITGAAAPRSDAALLHIARYAGVLRSLPSIYSAAAGHGLLNADPEHGTVRRIPLLAQLGGELVLTFGLETLRVAAKVPSLA